MIAELLSGERKDPTLSEVYCERQDVGMLRYQGSEIPVSGHTHAQRRAAHARMERNRLPSPKWDQAKKTKDQMQTAPEIMPEQKGYFTMKMNSIDQIKHEVLVRIAASGSAKVVHWARIPEDVKRLSADVILASDRLLAKDNTTAIVTTILRALNAIAEEPATEPALSIRERNAMERPRERKAQPASAPEPNPEPKSKSPRTMPRKQEEPIDVADLMRQYIEHEEAMREIQVQLIEAMGGVIPTDDEEEVEEEEVIEQPKKKRKSGPHGKRSYSCSKCGAPKPAPSSKCTNCTQRASEPVIEDEPDPEFEQEETFEEESY